MSKNDENVACNRTVLTEIGDSVFSHIVKNPKIISVYKMNKNVIS